MDINFLFCKGKEYIKARRTGSASWLSSSLIFFTTSRPSDTYTPSTSPFPTVTRRIYSEQARPLISRWTGFLHHLLSPQITSALQESYSFASIKAFDGRDSLFLFLGQKPILEALKSECEHAALSLYLAPSPTMTVAYTMMTNLHLPLLFCSHVYGSPRVKHTYPPARKKLPGSRSLLRDPIVSKGRKSKELAMLGQIPGRKKVARDWLAEHCHLSTNALLYSFFFVNVGAFGGPFPRMGAERACV